MKSEIAKKISNLKKELNSAKLIAVTKYSSTDEIETAYQAHQFDFGENRVQDLIEKAQVLEQKGFHKVKWHFIGHLQSNKVKELLRCPHLWALHSVDSTRLLEELLKREEEFVGSELKLFFQLNTSHEAEKSGFQSAEELEFAISTLLAHPTSKLKLYGLMTMGPIRTEEFELEAQRCFKDLKAVGLRLEEKFKLKNHLMLSMGMSNDYKIALSEGADFIRLGSAIFK